MQYERIVLNEPHASIEGLYDERLSGWDIDDHFLNELVFPLTDWHTDYLFHGFSHPNIKTVRFPFSRFIVDAERLWDDPMENIGQGVIYRYFEDYQRTLTKRQEWSLGSLWVKHQNNLKKNLCENALLLDCHSFPEDMGDVDICIGFNDDWSRPNMELLSCTVNLFEDSGYSVAINYPYSNAEAPECPFRYQSMMIEINKRVYLERRSIYLKTHYEQKKSIREVIGQLIETLVNSRVE